jgi:hypothetical protein
MAFRSTRNGVWALALLGGTLGTLGTGCATPQVAVDGLPLKRVVVYRNGVGYFERTGRVEAQEVKFRVRGTEVGDFLATMAVIEKGGSSVRSASFPLKVEEEDEPEPPPDDPSAPFLRVLTPPKKKDPNKLVNVLLSLDGKRHDLSVGYIAETPVWRPSYRLVVTKEGADLQAWGIVQNLSGEDWDGVQLSLVAGAPLTFAATLGTPVIPPRPEVSDQGEVIGAMPGAETSLAQGGLADRDNDGIVDREDACPDQPGPRNTGGCPPGPGGAAADPAAPTLDGLAARDEAESDDAGYFPAKDKKKAPARPKTSGSLGLRGVGSGGGGYGSGVGRLGSSRATAKAESYAAPAASTAVYPMAPPPPPVAPREAGPSAPRNLSALAAVAVEGSSTRYDIPTAVSVPDKSATMVMLLAQRVPGESGFLFAPAAGVPASQSHPFRVARFTNKTGGLLERGPIAVFEDGAFLGQGIVDPLPPDATTTVPFALERAIGLELQTKSGEAGARIAKIEGGELTIERDIQFITRYVAKNGGEKPARIFVKHNRRGGTRLHEPPKDTDDNTGTGTALVPLAVGAQTTGEVSVDERSTTSRYADWLSPLADEAVKAYLADSRADQKVVTELKKAWDIRPILLKAIDDERTLRDEQRELERSTEETRRNLKSLEKNTAAAALRKQLTDRLAASAVRLNEITKKLVELGLVVNEQRVRFQEIVRGIKLAQPLPPTTPLRRRPLPPMSTEPSSPLSWGRGLFRGRRRSDAAAGVQDAERVERVFHPLHERALFVGPHGRQVALFQ